MYHIALMTMAVPHGPRKNNFYDLSAILPMMNALYPDLKMSDLHMGISKDSRDNITALGWH